MAWAYATMGITSHSFDPYTDNGGSSVAIAGSKYVVVASDTRQSEGYIINSRNSEKIHAITANCCICINGFYADGRQLVKDIKMAVREYQMKNGREPSCQSVAQLVSTILYGKRFFPYYSFILISGVNNDGVGEVYSFDPVGSFERESYRSAGSAASLIQPFLDCRVGGKNQSLALNEMSVDDAIEAAKLAFTSAAERDIYTGDEVSIWINQGAGFSKTSFKIRRD